MPLQTALTSMGIFLPADTHMRDGIQAIIWYHYMEFAILLWLWRQPRARKRATGAVFAARHFPSRSPIHNIEACCTPPRLLCRCHRKIGFTRCQHTDFHRRFPLHFVRGIGRRMALIHYKISRNLVVAEYQNDIFLFTSLTKITYAILYARALDYCDWRYMSTEGDGQKGRQILWQWRLLNASFLPHF